MQETANLFSLEDLISLEDALALLPTARSKTTIWRWCRTGHHGVRLKHVMFPRRIYTTEAWLAEFAERCTAIELKGKERCASPVTVSDAAQQRDAAKRQQAAEAYLEQVGLRDRQHAAA